MRAVTYIDTDIGLLRLEAEEEAVISIAKVRQMTDRPLESAFLLACSRQIMEYLEGIRQRFDFPLKLFGTQFQKAVWEALLEIPYGATRCYEDICVRIGKPKAARAVGSAIGKNPCLLAVPCHRVIGKDGGLHGFAAGLDVKKRLLELESGD